MNDEQIKEYMHGVFKGFYETFDVFLVQMYKAVLGNKALTDNPEVTREMCDTIFKNMADSIKVQFDSVNLAELAKNLEEMKNGK